MATVLMRCGCAANGAYGDDRPCCVIHAPHPDAYTVADAPSLEGRTAWCAYHQHGGCPSHAPSALDLAFFEYRPTETTDQYYCGCWGWD